MRCVHAMMRCDSRLANNSNKPNKLAKCRLEDEAFICAERIRTCSVISGREMGFWMLFEVLL